MKTLSFIALVLIFISCKQKKIEINNLNNNEIEVMGHAGMGITSLYPINTAESIVRCLSEGADGTEMDIQLTKDNVLVAFHNADLDGNTNFTGQIRDYTWAELQLARYTSTPQLNYKIVNLRELFDGIGRIEDYTFTLDIKLFVRDGFYFDYIDDFTDALAQLYVDYSIHENVFIEAQDGFFLSEMASKDPQIGMYIYPATYEEALFKATELGLKGISIDNDKITLEQVKDAHSMGFFVTLWGVKTKQQNLDAVNKNPDMIQTDNIEYLVKLLK
jgi:glycerophosphoryl diester phosphodiesterase